MKCKGSTQISDLCDYLCNNKLIAYYCGFDITKPLPSYWTYVRFLKNLDNGLLKKVMKEQVLHLARLGIVDASFVGLDGTPVMANTCQNNPKSFGKDKYYISTSDRLRSVRCALRLTLLALLPFFAIRRYHCRAFCSFLFKYTCPVPGKQESSIRRSSKSPPEPVWNPGPACR